MPLEGVVMDLAGQPIASAEVLNLARNDAHRRERTLHDSRVWRQDDWRRAPDRRGAARTALTPKDELVKELPRRIVLGPCGYISGRVVDVESGQPVKLNKVVVCEVRRDEKGQPHSYGCGEARFEQPRDGEFSIAVSDGGEKHLTIYADGYDRAEQYVLDFDLTTGGRTCCSRCGGPTAARARAQQRIRGVVTQNGKPVAGVQVGLWQKMKEWDSVNAWLKRGRTVERHVSPQPCQRADRG